MNETDFDIVVVGGGMAGTALACAVAVSGLRIAVLEQTEPRDFDGSDYDLRVSAITLGSKAIFETIGAWQAMTQQRVSCVDAMEIRDEGGSGSICFDSAEIAQPCLAYIVENRVILRALLDRVASLHNIDYLAPVQVGSMVTDEQQAWLKLENGDEFKTRLVVGADGANSLVRRLSGIETHGWSFEQKAIVATVKTEHNHTGIARQRFLATGPLALLPLDDAHHCSIVWSADSARADELIALEDGEFNNELQQVFGEGLGTVKLVSARAAHSTVGRDLRHSNHGQTQVYDGSGPCHERVGGRENLTEVGTDTEGPSVVDRDAVHRSACGHVSDLESR